MRVTVTVTTRAHQDEIIERDGELRVRVTAAPIEGRANEAVVEVLSRHFGVAKSQLRIIRGLASRKKTIEVVW